MERSKLVATKEVLVKIKNVLSNTDVIEACTKERANTKWKFYKLTNVTVFAALLREVPMGFQDAVLPEPLTKNHTVKCVTYENTRKPYNDNLCLFRALALHLHGNGGLEEGISKIFTLFLQKIGRINAASFQGVCMDEIPIKEELVRMNIFLYYIDFVDAAMIGELARRSVGKHCNTVRLLRYNSQICYVFDINVLLKAYSCPTFDTFFNRAPNLERHLTTCSKRVKHVYQKNV